MKETIDAHATSSLNDCRLITLNKHHHENGNLTVVEGDNDLPFDIKRIYYIYDVPGGAERGGHSHKEVTSLLLAVSGSFNVTLTDGNNTITYTLNRSNIGLLIAPGIWNKLHDFSSGSVALAIASHEYDPNDYVCDFNEFLEKTASKRNND